MIDEQTSTKSSSRRAMDRFSQMETGLLMRFAISPVAAMIRYLIGVEADLSHGFNQDKLALLRAGAGAL